MEKVIRLGSSELKLHSSLFTIIEYRCVFGTELFSDIKKIEKLSNSKEEDISIIINTIFKIIFILNRPYSKLTYNQFLMNLDFSILVDTESLEDLSNTIGEMLGTLASNTSPQTLPR